MDPDFWHDRWQRGKTGFHQSSVSAKLIEYWGTLGIEPSARVFVPLSGKSRDMLWLHEQGHPIVGVELSPIAVRDFFLEAGIDPKTTQEGRFEVTEAGGFTLFRGDFFDLRAQDLEGVRGVYDRAALVALPADLRRAYARTLTDYLPPQVSILLVSFEYEPSDAGGPPFSVAEREVRELFEPAFRVEVLRRTSSTEVPGSLRERGVDTFSDIVYAIRR
jgi:thiopurine S-methyltransferase